MAWIHEEVAEDKAPWPIEASAKPGSLRSGWYAGSPPKQKSETNTAATTTTTTTTVDDSKNYNNSSKSQLSRDMPKTPLKVLGISLRV